MTAPGPDAVPYITDDAIDAGLRAWFALRVVPPGRSILRDRLRAAIATTLAAHQVDSTRSAPPGYHPTTKPLRGSYRPKDYR